MWTSLDLSGFGVQFAVHYIVWATDRVLKYIQVNEWQKFRDSYSRKQYNFTSGTTNPYTDFSPTNIQTDSMEQRPTWEANSFLVGQEIPKNICNPKPRYRVHKIRPLVPILSQIGPVRHFLFWRSILILSTHLRLRFESDFFPSGLSICIFKNICTFW